MARRSLRPQLNQIRTWVRQGRTDAWIAHQLEVTVQDIEAFKKQNDLAPAGDGDGPAADFDDDIDLRAEDDAAIAAELEAEAEARAAEEAAKAAAGEDDDAEDDDDKPRRRGRRGGRGRGRKKSTQTTFEGTFDHGEEGYGLWLDPAVADSAVYAEHWAGARALEVVLEEDQIVLRRAAEADDGDDD
ncbi:hypothetical protein [Conexibacter sp. SYSU D00693]|uniref:hypothetical protein n=1 Tax=Conexibacter sp. SYSU D00693 TaxID=2812560 RepID=UPI00196A67F8|nr:hypothetical protein [Conexibacter sp. SYSU D00693]